MSSEALEIHMFPCLADNYGYLLHDHRTGATAAIDTPDANAIKSALREKGWRLSHILNTHHHWDHAGGNLALKEDTGCKIHGPGREDSKIPGLDYRLDDGDSLAFGSQQAQVLHTPGHTLGHIVFFFPEAGAAFVGDTLFSMGCGRLFEGTPAQMWNSLQRLMALPDSTMLYCAHEYTMENARFALSLEPHNPHLQARAEKVRRLRKEGRPTLPATMAQEKKTNPFLRAARKELRSAVNMERASSPTEVFAEIRRRKDNF